MKVNLDEVRGYMQEVRGYMQGDRATAARIRERRRSWCGCACVPGPGWHPALECAPELHALEMVIRAVHEEHRVLGHAPEPERICELCAEAERQAHARLRAPTDGTEVAARA